MPVYAYRCTCGKEVDVLVRGGREPATCDDVPELAGTCASPGALARQLTAPYVHSGGSSGRSSAAEATCGHCGNVPGSCEN